MVENAARAKLPNITRLQGLFPGTFWNAACGEQFRRFRFRNQMLAQILARIYDR